MGIKIYYIPPVDKNNYLKEVSELNAIKALKISTVLVGANVLNTKYIYANNLGESIKKLDKAGNQVLGILQRVGYWGALLMAFWEVIGAIKDGDVNKIWGIAVKYALAYGTLYTLPWVFDLISTIFE